MCLRVKSKKIVLNGLADLGKENLMQLFLLSAAQPVSSDCNNVLLHDAAVMVLQADMYMYWRGFDIC